MLAMTATLGTILLTQMAHVNAGGVYLGEKVIPSVRLISSIRFEAATYMTNVEFRFIDPNATVQRETDSMAHAAIASIVRQLNQYPSLAGGGPRDPGLRAVTYDWRSYEAKTAPLISHQDMTNRGALGVFLTSYPAYEKMRSDSQQWLATDLRRAQRRLAQNRHTYSTTVLIGWALVALSIILGMGIATLVVRSVKRPVDRILATIKHLEEESIRSIREGVRAFADGDLTLRYRATTEPLLVHSTDELGRVAVLLAAIPYAEQPSHLPNSETDIAVRRFLANVLDPGASDAVATQARIHHVLATAGFSFAGQPIVSLDSGQVFAVESLARFPGEPPLSPDIWFEQAASIGLGVEFDLGAFAASLKLLDNLPPPCQLSINLGPQALSSPRLPRLLRASQPGRIIIELTEHMVIHDYPQLRCSVEHIRELGTQLAIDDTGAGFASLAHIVNLAPDLIKLDRGLTRGVHSDPARRAVAQSLVSLAHDIGAHVVAEGIETEEELAVVRDLGISYAQGYLLGRPTQITDLQWSFPEIAESGRAEPPTDGHGQSVLPSPASRQPAVRRWYARLGR